MSVIQISSDDASFFINSERRPFNNYEPNLVGEQIGLWTVQTRFSLVTPTHWTSWRDSSGSAYASLQAVLDDIGVHIYRAPGGGSSDSSFPTGGATGSFLRRGPSSTEIWSSPTEVNAALSQNALGDNALVKRSDIFLDTPANQRALGLWRPATDYVIPTTGGQLGQFMNIPLGEEMLNDTRAFARQAGNLSIRIERAGGVKFLGKVQPNVDSTIAIGVRRSGTTAITRLMEMSTTGRDGAHISSLGTRDSNIAVLSTYDTFAVGDEIFLQVQTFVATSGQNLSARVWALLTSLEMEYKGTAPAGS